MQSMSLIDHLEELRRRVAWSLLFFLGGVVVAFLYRPFFLKITTYPHEWAMNAAGLSPSLYVFSYQDGFVSQLKICLVVGFILSFPFILYHLLRFVMAGLFLEEQRKLLYVYLPASLILFSCGALFSYFFLIPYGLRFLILFGSQVGLNPNIGLSSYVSLFILLIVVAGLMFELPLVMALLVRIGLLSANDWKQKRRHAILTIFIVSAIVTPTPDPFNQCLMAGPLIVLYEVGCLMSSFVEKRLKFSSVES